MRNSWPRPIVTEVYPDVERVVRKVKIHTSSKGNLRSPGSSYFEISPASQC